MFCFGGGFFFYHVTGYLASFFPKHPLKSCKLIPFCASEIGNLSRTGLQGLIRADKRYYDSAHHSWNWADGWEVFRKFWIDINIELNLDYNIQTTHFNYNALQFTVIFKQTFTYGIRYSRVCCYERMINDLLPSWIDFPKTAHP